MDTSSVHITSRCQQAPIWQSDYFSASDHDEAGQPYEIHAGAPRIDSPPSPMTELWNSEMARQAKLGIAPGCDGRAGDEYFDYDVTYASSFVISVRTTGWEYCHCTPHGHGGTTSHTYVTQPRFHSLDVSDLFNLDSGWKNYLTERSYEVIEKKAEGASVDRSQVDSAATDIHHWTLTRDGLLITFDPYVALGYASGTTEVVISWRDLRPFLSATAPIPPGA
jgi:hypothetical protein